MSAGPVVQLRSGAVRGRTVAGIHRFLGVPYARPPIGEDRFRPPRPAQPWTGVRDALTYGPTAPQPAFALPPELDLQYPTVPGEDCLNLNVWTSDLGAAGHPVLVWLHGGGMEGGSSVGYDGSRFARDGVVCVTLNYRLGVEGFLHLDDGVANLGLLDQVAALEWVQDNIAAFGGDPDNVTIAGQSSGAMFVGMLLTAPRARGLFRRAILQSGAGNAVVDPETAHHVGRVLAGVLGVPPTREAIAAVPMPRLLRALDGVAAELAAHPDPRRWNGEPGSRVTAWKPVVDGQVLPANPLDAVAAGAGADVDVLIGSNAEEGRLSLVPFGGLGRTTDEVLAEAARLYELPVERALAVYREGNPGAAAGDLLALLQRDWWYRAPSYRLAEARARTGSTTYLYDFAWRSPQFDGLLGACHYLEVPFVFDLLDSPRFQQLTGPTPPQSLAEAMHAAWVSFVAAGEPGWPAYDLVSRPVQRFDERPRLVHDPAPGERTVWDGVF